MVQARLSTLIPRALSVGSPAPTMGITRFGIWVRRLLSYPRLTLMERLPVDAAKIFRHPQAPVMPDGQGQAAGAEPRFPTFTS